MIIGNFIKAIKKFKTHFRILNTIYEKENIISNLNGMFGTQFKKDWVGRLYTVVNPKVQGMVDPIESAVQIFEYTGMGVSNTMYIEKWVFDRFNLCKNFIEDENLFELLSYNIKKLDESDNYLVVLSPIAFNELKDATKKMLWLSLGLAIGITALTIIL